MKNANRKADPKTIHVVLPRALLALFPSASPTVDLEASTVNGLIDELDGRWPGMGDRLRDTSPAIRRHINIFVGGQRASLRTPLNPGTTVHVLTAISGG